jgi:hypothetical protein
LKFSRQQVFELPLQIKLSCCVQLVIKELPLPDRTRRRAPAPKPAAAAAAAAASAPVSVARHNRVEGLAGIDESDGMPRVVLVRRTIY